MDILELKNEGKRKNIEKYLVISFIKMRKNKEVPVLRKGYAEHYGP